jgi:hypothetical protein
MTDYSQIRSANIKKTLIPYIPFDNDVLHEFNEDSDVDASFEDQATMVYFNDMFYSILFSYLTSFPNVFKLLDIEECFQGSEIIKARQAKIVEMYKKDPYTSQYELYDVIMKLHIQPDINEEIALAIRDYAEDDVEYEDEEAEKDILILKINLENVDAIITKIKNSSLGFKKLYELVDKNK